MPNTVHHCRKHSTSIVTNMQTLGNLLTNACRSKYCLALREGDSKAKEDALAFQKLIEREWNDRAKRVALKRM